MAARPTWQGHLKLSLVTCPVALYTATSSTSHVSFHLINPETHNRIRMVATDPDTGPVDRSDLVKGFEVSKDEYVLMDDSDFEKVKLESTRTIDIDQFVDGSILVTATTDPDWVPIMKRAAAIVTDHGGRTSHAAIVSRELGLPALVGSGTATHLLHTGQEITVSCAEGDEGFVYEGTAEFSAEEIDVGALPAAILPRK